MSALMIMFFLSIITISVLSYFLYANSRQLTTLKKQVLLKQQELAAQLALKNDIENNLKTDTLTGIQTREIFEQKLLQTIDQSQRHQLLFAVLFLNLDGFKIINDALGLEVGDELLKKISMRLQKTIRDMDSVSRFAGDEFVFLIPQLAKPETIAYVAQRILDAVAEPFEIKGQEIFVTASVGIALYPQDGQEVEILLKNADSAMHQAKKRGPHNFQFYQEEMYAISKRELILRSSLHSAAIYQNLLIYYQAQINVSSKKIVCMDTILRWEHPDFGLIAYQDFIRLAENSGNSIAIGEWVLLTVCQQFQTWKNAGFYPDNIAVAVTMRQLENPHFIYKLSQILQENKLDPGCLILEISENIVESKLEILKKSLAMLKHLGVKIGITDFGTGNIALRHLQSLPIDNLKIASSLIQEMTQNPETKAIVKLIIALANTLNLTVSADSVDSAEQKQLLMNLGCTLMQGLYFSEPLLHENFTASIEKRILENV